MEVGTDALFILTPVGTKVCFCWYGHRKMLPTGDPRLSGQKRWCAFLPSFDDYIDEKATHRVTALILLFICLNTFCSCLMTISWKITWLPSFACTSILLCWRVFVDNTMETAPFLFERPINTRAAETQKTTRFICYSQRNWAPGDGGRLIIIIIICHSEFLYGPFSMPIPTKSALIQNRCQNHKSLHRILFAVGALFMAISVKKRQVTAEGWSNAPFPRL